MWTRSYWKQVAERAAKSAAQAVIGLATGDAFNVWTFDWKLAGGVALGAAVFSVLTSLVTAGIGQPDTPSAVKTD